MKKKEEYTESLDELYDYFFSIVKKYDEKTINLSKSNAEIFLDLYDKICNNEYQTVNAFARAVLKSYVVYNPKDIMPYINLDEMSIKRPSELIGKFISDYIVGKPVSCTKITDVNDVLAEAFSNKLEQVFGDIMFLPYQNMTFGDRDNLKRKLIENLNKKGYVASPYIKQVFLNTGDKKDFPVAEEYQKLLLDSYHTLVKQYVSAFGQSLKIKKMNNEDFDNFWEFIKTTLSSIEFRMTDSSLNDATFKKDKSIVENFYNDSYDRVKNGRARYNKGDYFNEVKTSLKNFQTGSYSARDQEILNKFYDKIMEVDEALKVKDEKGRNYPMNYFKYLRFSPKSYIELLSKYQKLDFLSESKKKNIQQAQTRIRHTFPTMSSVLDSMAWDVPQILEQYKGIKREVDGKVIDLTEGAPFDSFVEKVKQTIKENDLPSTQFCVTLIGREISSGRDVVKLPGKQEDKNK